MTHSPDHVAKMLFAQSLVSPLAGNRPMELEKEKKKQEAIYKLELKQLLDQDENLSEWIAIFSVRISQIAKLIELVEEQKAVNADSMAEMEKYKTLLRLTRQKIDMIKGEETILEV